MNKMWTMHGPADAPMVLERVDHNHPGHRGNKPRCHECHHPKQTCRCYRFWNGPTPAPVVDEAV